MQLLVVYDIATETDADQRRLRHVAKICEGYGVRVQKSVFECDLDAPTLRHLVHDLEKAMDPGRDSVGIYRLHPKPSGITRRLGTPPTFDQNDPYVL
jgi:CRISPR-associated protein Cas2